MLHRFIAIFLLTTMLLPASCGYHFTGEGLGPRPGLRTVAIPVFENNTSEPDLGSIFAGALRKEFLAKGKLQVVPVEQAEAIFRGRMTGISTSAVAHREAEATVQTRLYVTMEIRCVAVRDGAVIWQDPSFTYFQTFLQPTDANVSFTNRRAALEYLAQQMSIRIHDRFLSDF